MAVAQLSSYSSNRGTTPGRDREKGRFQFFQVNGCADCIRASGTIVCLKKKKKKSIFRLTHSRLCRIVVRKSCVRTCFGRLILLQNKSLLHNFSSSSTRSNCNHHFDHSATLLHCLFSCYQPLALRSLKGAHGIFDVCRYRTVHMNVRQTLASM